jgi:hypothetical protein
VIANCSCIAGYTGPDGEECDACRAGTYKVNNGSAVCDLCAIDLYSTTVAAATPDTCLGCPAHTRSDISSSVITNCSCIAGYTGYLGNDGGPCAPCAPGTYKVGNGTGVCIPCPTGTFLDTAAGLSPDSCIMCPADTYQAKLGADALGDCLACPANAISLEGSARCDSVVTTLQVEVRINSSLAVFDANKDLYLLAIARASGISVKHVTLLSTAPSNGRRLLWSWEDLLVHKPEPTTPNRQPITLNPTP